MMNDADLIKKIDPVRSDLKQYLLCHQNDDGLIRGKLSSSALSTAVSIFALFLHDNKTYARQIKNGILWLKNSVNADNGWGDTPKSQSNLSTTLLCMSALSSIYSTPVFKETDPIIEKAKIFVKKQTRGLSPVDISSAIKKIYGKDLTFAAPILTMMALSDFFKDDDNIWKYVPQLPFEIAIFPEKLLKMFKISVVSYALPALISIGLVRYKHRQGSNFLINFIRRLVLKKVIKKLKSIQPEHGGFLEAVPLTAFTVMSLIRSDINEKELIEKSIGFLKAGQRDDGSWPIATNVALWTTTLSVNALADSNDLSADNEMHGRTALKIKRKILDMQYKKIHPFTNAAPFAWSWTDLPGGVPDADDTAGALIALKKLNPGKDDIKAVSRGLGWLVNLQNSDGGIPTFCRGWGKLPFDRSCPEITAHTLMAFAIWEPSMDDEFKKKLRHSASNAVGYLLNRQNPDGSWTPLWFGNETIPNKENRVYGTSKVLEGLFYSGGLYYDVKTTDLDLSSSIEKGLEFLCSNQNSDGGWGPFKNVRSTIEETSVALAAICLFPQKENIKVAVRKGLVWLIQNLESKNYRHASPIGLYFESLWYYEKLYPVIFSLKALLNIKIYLKA